MYLSAFRPNGGAVDRADLLISLARVRGLRETDYSVATAGPMAAAVPAGRRPGRPSVVPWNHLFAVGDVRLDNRAELARLANVPNAGSDLELVVRALDACGEKCIASILGDFAFLLWDPRAHKLIAARDAFGVRPLYFRTTPDLLLFSDRMDALASDGRYDLDYIGDFLTGLVMPAQRTIWANVQEVPAGGFLVLRGTVMSARRYWSADAFALQPEVDEKHNTEQFLTLLRDAVRFRLGPAGATWAQLSGGLDSSSVVALAQNAGGPGQGLAGTITVVDTLGYGDERPYADSVIRRYDLRNEQVRDYWAWQDDGTPPPLTDGPRPLYPFYARDRQTVDVLRRAGGQVLLSGFGADHYLTGNINYITDLAARGKLATAIREVGRWSVSSRQSFWRLAHRCLVTPMAAAARIRNPKLPPLPTWIDPRFAAERGLATRTVDALETGGRPGSMFAHKLTRDIASIPAWIDRWPFGEDIEIRYPFLYRPLVEAGLQLPPALRIRPDGTKWILREAMRGLLPEDVRTRPTKGTIDARILWSLQRERARLDQLLRDPILAQLGCVSPEELRRHLDAARRGVPTSLVMLMSALSLETWLSVRSGRWTASRARQTAA
jgi:asparagine synthase (glutamine-hydrolysing)